MEPKELMRSFKLAGLLEVIETYSSKYEFSFQFWGEGNNNVFIHKGGVELTSFGSEKSIEHILRRTVEWVYRANRIPKEERVF